MIKTIEDGKVEFINDINNLWVKFDESDLQKFPEKNLWHYTSSSEAVSGMILDKKIWYSPYNDLNDPSEVSFGLKHAMSVLKYKKGKLDNIQEIQAYDLFINMIEGAKGMPELFFICFTEAGNDDVSQWREYGNRGFGYCIEFNSSNMFFNKNDFSTAIAPLKDILQVRPVIYNEDVQLELLIKFFNIFHKFILLNKEESNFYTYSFLRDLCAHFKHKAYSAEKEWRAILLSLPSGKILFSDIIVQSLKIKSQFRKKIILDLPAQKNPLDSIYRITCGPKQNESMLDATRMFVSRCLENIEHKIIVDHSDVPIK